MSNEERQRLYKEAVKEGLREFMDDKWATFGKWSAAGIGAAALVALVYFIMQMNGWKQP